MLAETSTGVTVLDGEDALDEAGFAVGFVGDLIPDGGDEVWIGAPGHANDAGRTYVVSGAFLWGNLPVDLGDVGGVPEAVPGFTLDGITPGDRAGVAVAAGDLDGDGVGDLTFGAPGVGVELVLSADGGAFAVDAQILAEDTGDLFGRTLAIGDLDQDGADDLVIGAPNFGAGSGKVYVFLGPLSPLTPPSATAASATLVAAGGALDSGGSALAIADVTGDGCPDLAIGASDHDLFAGAVYVFPGCSF